MSGGVPGGVPGGVQDVVVRFFLDVDRRDWAVVRSGLADVVRTDYTSLFGGEPESLAADDLVARWEGMLPGFDATQHLLGPLAVARAQAAGGELTLECNVRGYHHLGGGTWMVAGRYTLGVADADGDPKVAAIVLHTSYETGDRDLTERATERATGRAAG